MGAEQSAVLACTQTGKPEKFAKLENAEQFFQLYFDKMPEPKTGPVTEALLHLVMNAPPNLESSEEDTWDHHQEQDSGYEHDDQEIEDPSDEELDIDMVSEADAVEEFSDSQISIESSSTMYREQNNSDQSDFEMVSFELVDMHPIELLNVEDPQLEFDQEFVIRIADLNGDSKS